MFAILKTAITEMIKVEIALEEQTNKYTLILWG